MSRLFIYVVIPCLNEEETLRDTCRSLGFGDNCDPAKDAVLILVDNGSEDRTQSVAQQIQNSAPADTIVLAQEQERGYVPARSRGCNVAAGLANMRGVAEDTVLLVQADADTTYSAGYLESMRQAALSYNGGAIFECCMEWPSDFIAQHPNYIALCDQVDQEYESLLSNNPDDVVIDDKSCAYRLSDYRQWGGHQREFTPRGDEVYSETTRLYLRAKAHGAQRYFCEAAVARHSARRILNEPALSFATAGFPRETAFRAAWERTYDGPLTVADFANPALRPNIRLAIAARQAHLGGLFHALPLHVAQALGRQTRNSTIRDNDFLGLPKRSLETLRNQPAIFLEDIFQRIDQIVFGEL